MHYQTLLKMRLKKLKIQMLKEWLGSEAHRNAFKVKRYKIY